MFLTSLLHVTLSVGMCKVSFTKVRLHSVGSSVCVLASDGYGEDTDLDGMTDMALLYEDGTLVPILPADYPALGIGIDNCSTANSASTLSPKPYTSRAINYDALFAAYNVTDPTPGKSGTKQTNGWPRLVITETDPLCTDTDHDGLPDGWEANYQLDPLNNGVYDFRTGRFTDDPTHGPAGNPDNDTYLQGGVAVPYDNAAEYLGGTNPRSSDNREGGEIAGAITVGTGNPIGSVNGTTFSSPNVPLAAKASSSSEIGRAWFA